MVLGRFGPISTFTIGNINVKVKNQVKLLGIFIDDKLRFNSHSELKCQNAGNKISALRRIRQLFNENAKGRFIISENSYKLLDIGKYLRRKFGEKYPTPRFIAPKFLVWLFSPMLGVKRTFIAKNVGYDFYFDNNKSIKDLGLKYISVEESTSDFFQQFIDHNLI